MGALTQSDYYHAVRSDMGAKGRVGVVGNAYRTSREGLVIDTER